MSTQFAPITNHFTPLGLAPLRDFRIMIQWSDETHTLQEVSWANRLTGDIFVAGSDFSLDQATTVAKALYHALYEAD